MEYQLDSIHKRSKPKVFIFSHKSDIDGMGSVILLKLTGVKTDYKLCVSNDIDRCFKKLLDDGHLFAYDNIYITDLHLDDNNMKLIQKDNSLRGKIRIFDHNESALKYNCYDFANIAIKKSNKDCCATTLFYDYLLNHNMLERKSSIDKFCEAIRVEDTGGVSTLSKKLALLFNSIGTEKFISNMYTKLYMDNMFVFTFADEEIIKKIKEETACKVKQYVDNMHIRELYGYKIGICNIEYKYRNDIATFLRKNNMYNIDLVMLFCPDHNSISIRGIKPDINVRPIAEKFGGQGHHGAAGCILSKERFYQIYRNIEQN